MGVIGGADGASAGVAVLGSSRPTGSPPALADIVDRSDVIALLRDFYGRAFRDDLLGPVFVEIARMDLEAHLPVMGDFWESALFRAGTYRRNALRPHQRLHDLAELTPAHFERWLALWRAAVTDRHAGPKAELAKLQGSRIAGAMCRRLTGMALPGSDADRARRPHHTDAAGGLPAEQSWPMPASGEVRSEGVVR